MARKVCDKTHTVVETGSLKVSHTTYKDPEKKKL